MGSALGRILAIVAVLAPAASANPLVEISNELVLVDHQKAISTDLLFGVGEATLTAPGRELLDGVAKRLAKDPAAQLAVNCHTDNTAPDNDRTGVYLRKLSQDRANAVAAYLARHGIAAKRITAQGFGADQALGDNTTDDGRAENRRLEILVKTTTIAAPPTDVRAPIAADLLTYTHKIRGHGRLIATLNTNHGAIHCELFEQQAPMTVANFVGLATGQKPWLDSAQKVARNRPFYDGLTFHRVIPNFMIQGGDPLGTGTGGPGYAFKNEIVGLHNDPGSLAMANAGPDTNGSQFFINEGDNQRLDAQFTVFGMCREMDIITDIANVARDSGDRPKTPVVIRSVTFAREP